MTKEKAGMERKTKVQVSGVRDPDLDELREFRKKIREFIEDSEMSNAKKWIKKNHIEICYLKP